MDRTNIAASCFAGGVTTVLTALIGFGTLGAWVIIPSVLLGATAAFFGYKPKEVWNTTIGAWVKTKTKAPLSIQTLKNAGQKLGRLLWGFAGLIIWAIKLPFLLTRITSRGIYKRPFLALYLGLNVLLMVGALSAVPWVSEGNPKEVGFWSLCAVFCSLIGVLWLTANATRDIKNTLEWLGDEFAHKCIINKSLYYEWDPHLKEYFQTDGALELMSMTLSWHEFFRQVPYILLAIAATPWRWCYQCLKWIGEVLSIIKSIMVLATMLGLMLFVGYLKLTHSSRRVICMIDGPLGGLIGLAILFGIHGMNALTLPWWQLGCVAIGSGLLSATIGILNDAFVKERLLPRLETSLVTYMENNTVG